MVSSFGRIILYWASIELGTHKYMPRVHMMDEEYKTWNSLKMAWGIYPSPHMLNTFPRRGKTSPFWAWLHLGGLGLGGEVTYIGSWKFWMGLSLHHEGSCSMLYMSLWEASILFFVTNNLIQIPKCPLNGWLPTKIRVLLHAKMNFKWIVNITLLKGEILGLLTPILVVYPLICV